MIHEKANDMATQSLYKIVTQLRRFAMRPGGGDVADGQLLGRFVDQQDEDAFAALVKRHGSMVMGVCQRVLNNSHDADDAFQATFLILVHKAATLKTYELVGNWLYGVAYRTALTARAASARRRRKEKQVIDMPHRATTRPDDWSELRPLLDEELSQLGDVYREAVVLCDLEGKTRGQAAQKLGVPESTLSGRLTTARRQLAKRLTRRGLTLSAGAVATILSQSAASAWVPHSLVVSTIKAATSLAAGSAATGLVSTSVVALAEGTMKAMFMTKVKTLTAVVLAGLLAMSALLISPTVAKPVLIPQEKKDDRKEPSGQQKEAGKKDEPKKVEGQDKQGAAAEDRVIESVDGIDTLMLEGKVRKLTIKSIAGAAQVNCGNLEAEEIEIDSIDGVAMVNLKLANGKLKKLVIGKVNGASKLDCSMLEVDAIDIKEIDGAGEVNLKAKGNVAVGSMSGVAKLIVSECQDFIVAAPLEAVASVEAQYRGTAKCEGGLTAQIKLTKIDAK